MWHIAIRRADDACTSRCSGIYNSCFTIYKYVTCKNFFQGGKCFNLDLIYIILDL